MSGKRLSSSDITMIVRELERWRDGQLGSKLTWAILESTYGYSRQALQAHVRIKLAYTAAKESLRGGLVKTREKQDEEVAELKAQVQELQSSVKDHLERERKWRERWQRIAYHLRNKGINVSEIDSDVPSGETPPSKKESECILIKFDRPMLPTGRT